MSSTYALPVVEPAVPLRAPSLELLSAPVQKCRTCKLNHETCFGNLPAEALYELDRIKRFRNFTAGDRLFTEGQAVKDVTIVCEGAVSLSFSSCNGSVVMLGMSEPGELLGLSSALSGHAHETTADVLTNTRVAAISRADFLRFIERYPAAALSLGAALSRKVNRAYDKIRLIGSGLSVPQRLAAWLLRLQEGEASQDGRLRITLTHERIAQLLGVSRESITRALSQFRKQGVVEVRGIHVYVRDRAHLRAMLDPVAGFACDQRH